MTLLYKFSNGYNLRKSNCVFDNIFVTMLLETTGDILASLSFHVYFDNTVIFLDLECLESFMWLWKHSLKVVTVTPRIIILKIKAIRTISFQPKNSLSNHFLNKNNILNFSDMTMIDNVLFICKALNNILPIFKN